MRKLTLQGLYSYHEYEIIDSFLLDSINNNISIIEIVAYQHDSDVRDQFNPFIEHLFPYFTGNFTLRNFKIDLRTYEKILAVTTNCTLLGFEGIGSLPPSDSKPDLPVSSKSGDGKITNKDGFWTRTWQGKLNTVYQRLD